MKTIRNTLAIGLLLSTGLAHAAGFNHIWPAGTPHEGEPLVWNTSEVIPVWTDGGEAFTFDYDGVTPFITIERANEITEFAYGQWNAVATATFEAQIAGTIADATGGAITDVTGDNAAEIYEAENGYGFWVLYDTHGDILENYFGVPRTSVLGIAFPELADEVTGEITEATAVINGWNVWDTDTNGDQVAGVFTHEFGHTLNLSHSQVNGQMAYRSSSAAPEYPGVAGCDGVEPVWAYRYSIYPWYLPNYGGSFSDPDSVETMYPLIDHGGTSPVSGLGGIAQSTVDMPDDIAALSALYPSEAFASTTGSITGKVTLKDGKTGFPGINVIARSVSDPFGKANSAMSGHLTLGSVGPDGDYLIQGLTPGEEYLVYVEYVDVGGYPTGRQSLPSVAEYWNANESNDPVIDDACDATPIVAEAGVTKNADIIFNGYLDGIQYTPLVSAFLTDLAKNGKSSAGMVGTTAFKWDENHEFKIFPSYVLANNGAMNRNGSTMLVNVDFSGNGISQMALATFKGNSDAFSLTELGELSDGECGGSSSIGISSTYGWSMDDAAQTVVGTQYLDTDGDGLCQSGFKGEVQPYLWTQKGGAQVLDMGGINNWVRAHAVSGNGRVVLGTSNFSIGTAWVDGGELINLYDKFGARTAYASSYDGTRVAIDTYDPSARKQTGVVLWNAYTDEAENIGGLKWCEDIPYIFFGRDYCELLGDEVVQDLLGTVPVEIFDSNDAATVLVGRAGSFRTGIYGAIWIEGIGWKTMADFLREQGVMEAMQFPIDSPYTIDGKGNTLIGGLAGAMISFHIDMEEVFVCMDGVSMRTPFPTGTVDAVAEGAELGRCEFIE